MNGLLANNLDTIGRSAAAQIYRRAARDALGAPRACQLLYSRYGAYSERAYSRQFLWGEFHAKTLKAVTANTHELVVAHDASFIPKSGKKTYRLDKIYNDCASQPERGLYAWHTKIWIDGTTA